MSWIDEFVDFTKCEVELTEKSIRILETISKEANVSPRVFINAAIARVAQDPSIYKKEVDDKPEDYIFGVREPVVFNKIPLNGKSIADSEALEELEEELIEDIDFSNLKGGKQRSEAIYMKARWLGISRKDVYEEIGISKAEMDGLYSKYDNNISEETKQKINAFLERNK